MNGVVLITDEVDLLLGENHARLTEVARKAGMEAAEWEAIEVGHVPTTREQLKSLATGLDMEWTRMVFIATFCRNAWGR